jgi:hypothetical protein
LAFTTYFQALLSFLYSSPLLVRLPRNSGLRNEYCLQGVGIHSRGLICSVSANHRLRYIQPRRSAPDLSLSMKGRVDFTMPFLAVFASRNDCEWLNFIGTAPPWTMMSESQLGLSGFTWMAKLKKSDNIRWQYQYFPVSSLTLRFGIGLDILFIRTQYSIFVSTKFHDGSKTDLPLYPPIPSKAGNGRNAVCRTRSPISAAPRQLHGRNLLVRRNARHRRGWRLPFLYTNLFWILLP